MICSCLPPQFMADDAFMDDICGERPFRGSVEPVRSICGVYLNECIDVFHLLAVHLKVVDPLLLGDLADQGWDSVCTKGCSLGLFAFFPVW